MSTIYEQAIADAKKLREVAEKNATNRVIESIAPRIRRLIEQEITGEIEDEYGEDATDPVADMSDEIDDLDSYSTDPSGNIEQEELVGPSDSFTSSEGDIEIEEEEPEAIEDEKNVTVNITVESRLDRRSKKLREHAVRLVLKLKESKTKKQKQKILSELSKIKKLLVLTNESDKKLGKEINEVLKESIKMSRRKTTRKSNRRKSWINENAWWLFEGGDEGEDLDLELEEEGEEVDVPTIKTAVEDLAAAVGLSVAEEGEEEEGDEEVDLGDEGEEEEEGGEEALFDESDRELQLDWDFLRELDDEDPQPQDMREEDEEEPQPQDMRESDEEKLDDEDEKLDENDIVEISEAAIRRELAKLRRRGRPQSRRRVSETTRRRRAMARRRRRLAEMGDPVAAMHDAVDDVIEVTEEDLINALAEELGETTPGGGDATKAVNQFGGGESAGEPVSETRRRRRRQRRVHETKSQKKELLEARRQAAAAKRELKESNLFNAKLLYVNKLMQQHDLNSKQQRAIVEAIDNAKTHREAKLLYTSLTESLRRRDQRKSGSSNLNEGLVRGGSASSPARSSAPAKTSTGLNRWALLAGIKK